MLLHWVITMDTIRIIGHVFPRAVLLNVIIPHLDWDYLEGNVTFHFKTNINSSIINVECSMPQYRADLFTEIYRRSFDLATTACALAGFALGDGFTCVFEFVILPDGTPSTLRLNDPNFAGLANSYSLEPSHPNYHKFQEIVNLIILNPPLLATLQDLVEVVALPHRSVINSGRVIDSIRRLMFPTLKGAKAWQAMQKALNVSCAYQEYISKQSTGPRHGDRLFIPGPVGQEVAKRAWIIFDRYLEFIRRGGNQPLAAPEFPELI
jgi:hypothetical protein